MLTSRSITQEELHAWLAYLQNWKTERFHGTRRLPDLIKYTRHADLANETFLHVKD